jgi:hypothetical protein
MGGVHALSKRFATHCVIKSLSLPSASPHPLFSVTLWTQPWSWLWSTLLFSFCNDPKLAGA